MKKIELTETVLRDAHQSLLATRMRTEDMLPIAGMMGRAGFWSLEVWGGATFDASLRYLKECPWERLRKLQNQDGTWAGHHCITSRTFCTAASVMTLTAEREAN